MGGYEVFGEEEIKAINDLLRSNGGNLFAHSFEGLRNNIFKVREFEKVIAERFGSSFGQAVSSGSAALWCALKAVGIKRGDEVIIPSFTFIATAEAVLHCGATPVVVDIDSSFNLCPTSFENAISKKTVAVIPVHMLGVPANMKAILKIAKKHNLKIVEDAAQATGGKYFENYLGTIGDIGCFSFDGGKNIQTGEGGMILTNSRPAYVEARARHDHGHAYSNLPRGKDPSINTGFNFRMTELQAAIGIVQLNKLDSILEAQRFNKSDIKKRLIAENAPFVFRQIEDPLGEIADTLVFSLPNPKIASQFFEKLCSAGFGVKNIPDALSWHFAPLWSSLLKRLKDASGNKWEVSAKLLYRSIAIPINVKMSPERKDRICSLLLKCGQELC